MSRKLRRLSAFDRWMGNRFYLYYLIGWVCMIMYAASIWNAEIQCFYDLTPYAIGLLFSILAPFLILVFLDYLAFCIHQHKLLKRLILYDPHSYASGWEIQNALYSIRIPDEEWTLSKNRH